MTFRRLAQLELLANMWNCEPLFLDHLHQLQLELHIKTASIFLVSCILSSRFIGILYQPIWVSFLDHYMIDAFDSVEVWHKAFLCMLAVIQWWLRLGGAANTTGVDTFFRNICRVMVSILLEKAFRNYRI